MNKQYHLSKKWLIKKLVFWFWLHMITFGVTAWLVYRKYRNVSFELTDTAIKFRNGRLTPEALCLVLSAWRETRPLAVLSHEKPGIHTK